MSSSIAPMTTPMTSSITPSSSHEPLTEQSSSDCEDKTLNPAAIVLLVLVMVEGGGIGYMFIKIYKLRKKHNVDGKAK